MTVKELKDIINNLPDDVEVEVNSIYNYETEQFDSSPISEAHYCEMYNKVYIAPEIISI